MKDGRNEWPAEGLENVPICPVCASNSREILHRGLVDGVFFCAPGKWNMYRCLSCTCSYLDPRPTAETIGLAYQRYYTHHKVSSFSSLTFLGKLRRWIANGYRNHQYGTNDLPAFRFGPVAAKLMPNGKATIDAGMRHLPKAQYGQRLLDLGCGNSEFLLRARSAGWDVVGVDFDSKAVEAARGRGLDVRLGGIRVLDPNADCFDVITMAHVIEHLHNPMDVLRACHRLLKPGGFLWIETPNAASYGHGLFGAAWRGLEPPRHLILFTLESLRSSLSGAGFSETTIQPYRPLCANVFRASVAISEGGDPYSESRPTVRSDIVTKAEKVATIDPSAREFITLKAWKT